ncbi:hypothetical protein Tco_0890555 [Tanacetum coccineum]|uniref:Coatomer subunit zeta n=1 Tax=Tanacetum coccineum TaxID=301880 RepID=A0ABQ5C1Z3_9ASTR
MLMVWIGACVLFDVIARERGRNESHRQFEIAIHGVNKIKLFRDRFAWPRDLCYVSPFSGATTFTAVREAAKGFSGKQSDTFLTGTCMNQFRIEVDLRDDSAHTFVVMLDEMAKELTKSSTKALLDGLDEVIGDVIAAELSQYILIGVLIEHHSMISNKLLIQRLPLQASDASHVLRLVACN